MEEQGIGQEPAQGWGTGKLDIKEYFRMWEGKQEPKVLVLPVHSASQHATHTAKNLMYSLNVLKIVVTGQQDASAGKDTCYPD